MPEITPGQHEALMKADAPVFVRDSSGRFDVGTRNISPGRSKGARDKFGAEVFTQAIDLLRRLEADPDDAEALSILKRTANPVLRLVGVYMDPEAENKDVIAAADKLAKIMWGTRQNVTIDLSDDEAADPSRSTRMLLALERLRK